MVKTRPLTITYPKYVKPLRKVGACHYTKNGKPCCTFGHVARELTGQACSSDYEICLVQKSKPCAVYSSAYVTIYHDLVKRGFIDDLGLDEYCSDVSTINDQLPHSARVLLYNLTWAALGYEYDQSTATLSHVPEAREALFTGIVQNGKRLGHDIVLSSVKRLVTRNLNREPHVFITF